MERVAEIVPIDCPSIHEDMAGKSGPPLFGPAQIEAFCSRTIKNMELRAGPRSKRYSPRTVDGNMNPVDRRDPRLRAVRLYPREPAAEWI